MTARRRMPETMLDAGPGARAVPGVPELRELARGGIEARDAAPPTPARRSSPTPFAQSGSRLAGLDTWAPSSSRARSRSRRSREPRPLRLEDVVARLSAPDRRATRAAAAMALVAAGLTWEEVAGLRVASFLPRTSPASVIVLEQPARRAGGWYAPLGEQLFAGVAAWWKRLPARGPAFGEFADRGAELRGEVLGAARARGLAVDIAALDRCACVARRLWRRRDGARVVHDGTAPAQTTAPAADLAARALYQAAIAALEPAMARMVERVEALEAAERTVRAQLAGDAPRKCSAWSSARPCDGELGVRWCATCGEVVFRCQVHGGAAAATADIMSRHAIPLGHLVTGGDVAALPALRAEALRMTGAGVSRGRRSRQHPALEAIAVELVGARAALAASKRTRDELERLADGTDAARCDAGSPSSPCSGAVRARWCAQCGWTVRICRAHGDLRRATHRLEVHRRECPGGGSRA